MLRNDILLKKVPANEKGDTGRCSKKMAEEEEKGLLKASAQILRGLCPDREGCLENRSFLIYCV